MLWTMTIYVMNDDNIQHISSLKKSSIVAGGGEGGMVTMSAICLVHYIHVATRLFGKNFIWIFCAVNTL